VFWRVLGAEKCKEDATRTTFQKSEIGEIWGKNQKFAKNVKIAKKSGDQTLATIPSASVVGASRLILNVKSSENLQKTSTNQKFESGKTDPTNWMKWKSVNKSYLHKTISTLNQPESIRIFGEEPLFWDFPSWHLLFIWPTLLWLNLICPRMWRFWRVWCVWLRPNFKRVISAFCNKYTSIFSEVKK